MLHYHIKGRRSRGPPSVRLHPPCRRGSLPNRPGGRRRHDAVGGSVRGRGRSPQTYYPAAGSSVDLAIGAGAARWADGSAGAGVPRDLLWRRPPALTWRLARAVDEAIPCGPPSVWRPPWCFSADPLQRGGLSRRSGGRRGAGVGAVGAGRVGPWAWSACGASIAVVAPAAFPACGGDGGDRWLVPWQRTGRRRSPRGCCRRLRGRRCHCRARR